MFAAIVVAAGRQGVGFKGCVLGGEGGGVAVCAIDGRDKPAIAVVLVRLGMLMRKEVAGNAGCKREGHFGHGRFVLVLIFVLVLTLLDVLDIFVAFPSLPLIFHIRRYRGGGTFRLLLLLQFLLLLLLLLRWWRAQEGEGETHRHGQAFSGQKGDW